MNKFPVWLIVAGIAVVVLTIVCFAAFEIVTVEGNQMGVKETWSGGVESDPYLPKTYFLFPGWTQKLHLYDMSYHILVMNDIKGDVPKGGKDYSSYKVQSAEGQDMWISLQCRWRIDPSKLVHIHQTIRTDIEEKLVIPSVLLIVKNEATELKAIEAFSGTGLVKLQSDILKEFTRPESELRQQGIIVEAFVIEGIRLDETYIGEIRARQVATQRKLRADEETKAAEAVALKTQAEAKADYNKRIVEGERDKQVGILKAEEDAQIKVLAAKAESNRVTVAADAEKTKAILAAEGEKESGLLRAQAIEALGKAEAEATKLKLSAYAVPGADAFVKIEVARAIADGYKNIKGYLPSSMNITLLTDNFNKAVDIMTGNVVIPVKPVDQK